MRRYLQAWTVLRRNDEIHWFLETGQLRGDLHGVSVLDGHVVGNSPPSSRRSTKSRSLPLWRKLTPSIPPFFVPFAFRSRALKSTTKFTSKLPFCLG